MEQKHQYRVGDYVWARDVSERPGPRGRLGKLTRIDEGSKVVWVQFGQRKPMAFLMAQIKPYHEEEKS